MSESHRMGLRTHRARESRFDLPCHCSGRSVHEHAVDHDGLRRTQQAVESVYLTSVLPCVRNSDGGWILCEDGQARRQCRDCRLAIVVGVGASERSAIAFARKRAAALGGCFHLWHLRQEGDPWDVIDIADISGGRQAARTRYDRNNLNPVAYPKQKNIHTDLRAGAGRFSEIAIFHHSSDVSEQSVIAGLRHMLVNILSVPACRIYYWTCNAETVLFKDTVQAELDSLMRAMIRTGPPPCDCDSAELVIPTGTRCSVSPAVATPDGQIRRRTWRQRQDKAIAPSPLGAPESGSLFGAPVGALPK